MKDKIHSNLLKAIGGFFFLSVLILALSYYFIFNNTAIGFVFIGVGIIDLLLLKFFKINLKSVYPDIIFGMIDNGVLIFAAIIGGNYAGVIGAIIGGAAGNTITDGIGGLFEGHISEKMRKRKISDKRTALSTTLGKMAGCLFGAGIGMILVHLVDLLLINLL